jgi:hypothetical protein
MYCGYQAFIFNILAKYPALRSVLKASYFLPLQLLAIQLLPDG